MAKCGFCGIRKPSGVTSCWYCGQNRIAEAARHAQEVFLQSSSLPADSVGDAAWPDGDDAAGRGGRSMRRRLPMLFGRRTRRGKGGPVVVRPGWVIYHVFFVLLMYYVLLVVFVGGDWRWLADRPWVMVYRWIAG